MSVRSFLVACLTLACLLPVLAESRTWSKDGTFSLIGPPGWEVSKPARNILMFTSGKAELELECFSEPVPITDPAYKAGIGEALDPKQFTLVSQADVRISGMDAVQCELQGVGDFQHLVGRLVVLTDRHRTWFITCTVPKEEAGEVFGRMEEALVTLQLK